jgi:hypothetical protein
MQHLDTSVLVMPELYDIFSYNIQEKLVQGVLPMLTPSRNRSKKAPDKVLAASLASSTPFRGI